MLAVILASTMGSLQPQYNTSDMVKSPKYLSYHKQKVIFTWAAAARMLAAVSVCGVASCKLQLGRQTPPGGSLWMPRLH
jgi:hypothetical protein